MLGECDGVTSALDMELETLRCIYLDELQVDVNGDGKCTSIAVWLYPATADKVEEQYVRIFLKIKLPEKYPETIPEICINNPRGLSDEQIDRIVEKLLSIAKNSKGSAMLFELIEAAKEKLTAENRPNEDCAICLYGFHEKDVFIRTDCYHYFHCHCLSRYMKCKLQELAESDDASGNEETEKQLCPVCRVPIQFVAKEEDYPEPVAVADAAIILDIANLQKPEMERLYQKQLAQGGIIDVEAEKNKFLLEIANVPTATECKENGKGVSETPDCGSNCDSLENDGNKHKKLLAASFPNMQSNRGKYPSRGTYRQPYRKRCERNGDFKEQKKVNGENKCQSNENETDAHVDLACSEENTHLDHHDSEQTLKIESQSNDAHSNEPFFRNTSVPRNNRSRGYSHQPVSRNFHNAQPRKPYNSYNDDPAKQRGGYKRGGGRRAYTYPSHSVGGSVDTSEEKYVEKENFDDRMQPEQHIPSANEHKPFFNHSKNNERYNRPNTRTGPKFFGGRNFPQPRFQKYHQPNSYSNNMDHVENEKATSNFEGAYNHRPYRPRYQDSHRPFSRGGHHNYDPRSRDQVNFSRTSPAHSQRYGGRNHGGNWKWNESDRNGNVNSKASFQGQDFKGRNSECNDVRQSLSNVHLGNRPPGISPRAQGQVNCARVPESGTKTVEKGTPVVRPPPGFANPLKKVVYGLPSLNPPPGFGPS